MIRVVNTKKGQGTVDAYVLRLLSRYPNLDTKQIIGLTMFDLNLFYDAAKPMVETALLSIQTHKS